jgi:glycerate dehydrogenase
MKGVMLDRGSLDPGDLDLSGLDAVIDDWSFYEETHPDEVIARLIDAQIVVSNKVVLDEAVLSSAPDLKLICVAATGTNNVDLAAAKSRGIMVCNVTGYATPSVVEHVFAIILALSRRLPDWQQAIEKGHWQQATHFCLLDYPMGELNGKTLGIVGYGELGRAVAQVAKAFGMQVLIAERPGGGAQSGRLPLEELLPQVDVLSLHCPLTDNTRNLISKTELELMKPTAILINTARGGIVDEAALAAALHAGQIGGAGVDVLTTEPPVKGNVLLDESIPNLIVTPHIAWASVESRQRLVNEVVENIRAFLDGTPRNRVA